MAAIPRDRHLESTLALWADPYRFISRRARAFGSDVFEARILLERTLCLTGAEAAELFYDPVRFSREQATPGRIVSTLFGGGGVQGLDGPRHLRRKRMLLSLMLPDRIGGLVEAACEQWREAAHGWQTRGRINLYEAFQETLARAVCAWAGVPLGAAEAEMRGRDLSALFDQAGAVGPRHWQARVARHRAGRWAERLVRQARMGRLPTTEGSVLDVISRYREDGQLLEPRIAAVELLNVLRPTVAVSVYLTFVATALHCHPHARRGVEEGGDDARERFVQEVRRFYPFFPMVAARVRDGFRWRGHRFPRGRRVLLDLYGTNHDPRSWEAPNVFDPERFRGWAPNRYALIPQGGGHRDVNHRCPGEWITLALMKALLGFLQEEVAYEVPPQDLSLEWRRLPAVPRSRFVIAGVIPHR